ncbi:alpha/beta hydrolase [Sphingomicrobium astaxanthinifaciens]|uniref:alpha/beta hydrolase n=1 Tax=Sphingomicrobium astaxanthinifaciens TaxID=1227949 RepID=UPI001FCBE891|nr:alpha/beta hydrolase-fold protein [Sphingomicrobium astaxanthinifaciens]MCJ7421378.1 hypothetical protein [Sphingomicrobium astaxanthinifaciens]
MPIALLLALGAALQDPGPEAAALARQAAALAQDAETAAEVGAEVGVVAEADAGALDPDVEVDGDGDADAPPRAAGPVDTLPGAATLPAVAAGRITQMMFDDGAAAGVGEVWVWTPPSYGRDPRARYPVLYVHDGQNLFDPAFADAGQAWGIDEAITRLAARGDLREWIVVGIRSPRERWRALFPEKLYDFLPAARQRALAEPRGALVGDAYLGWMVERLKPYIDRRYPTHAGPENTAVMGAALGGLTSLYAVAEYPHVFGQGAALSARFALPDADTGPADPVGDIVAAWDAYLDSTHIDPQRNALYLDHGTAPAGEAAGYHAAFAAMMRKGGWPARHFESRRFTGAAPDVQSWRERIDIPLAFLDRYDP